MSVSTKSGGSSATHAEAAPAALRARRVAAPRRGRRLNLTPYLYVAPAVVFYTLFAFAPLLHTAWLSLFEWDGITQGTWVGLGNYRALAEDEQLLSAFGHSVVLILFYAVLPATVGIIVAAFLARSVRRGLTIYRTLLFLPQAIATVVSGVAWKWIYVDSGPLSTAMRSVGLGSLVPESGWLGDPSLALAAIGLVGSWIMIGLCTVLFLAGAQSIATSLYDAARVDGAGPVREFLAVTLPSLRGELAFALSITAIAALRSFDLVYVMTGGGPDNATKVPAVYLYQRAFQNGEVGAACAVAVVLTLIIFAVTALIARLQPRRER
jgi:raffinose/stachyose/melibiose transport system permease protein